MDVEPVVVIADRPHRPLRCAIALLARCAARTVVLLARRELTQPTGHVGDVLRFGDGSHGCVYRETVVTPLVTDDPAFLVVAFRLRWVRGFGHALFRPRAC